VGPRRLGRRHPWGAGRKARARQDEVPPGRIQGALVHPPIANFLSINWWVRVHIRKAKPCAVVLYEIYVFENLTISRMRRETSRLRVLLERVTVPDLHSKLLAMQTHGE